MSKVVESKELYLLTRDAMPEILLKVLETKDLIKNSEMSILNATKKVGISRTTYYKYSNSVFCFNGNVSSKNINLEILMIDKVGMLSVITKEISKNGFNIITISQHPPLNNNTKTIIEIAQTDEKSDLSNLIKSIKKLKNIISVKIISINSDE